MTGDKELEAIKTILEKLASLNSEERDRVLNYILERLGIADQGISKTSSPGALSKKIDTVITSPPQEFPRPEFSRSSDIKTLKEEKSPTTANQMVALVAYYLSEVAPEREKRNYITANDINKYFRQAQFPLPKRKPADALTNAKNAGYLESTSAGHYNLNPVGYNLVAHKMPLKSGSKSVKKPRKPKKVNGK